MRSTTCESTLLVAVVLKIPSCGLRWWQLELLLLLLLLALWRCQVVKVLTVQSVINIHNNRHGLLVLF
jgi:hypothetical protein